MNEWVPQRILLVGDLHGDGPWVGEHVLPYVDEHGVDLIIQLGDFGYWPKIDVRYLHTWESELARRGIELWFVDGNHEDHPTLNEQPVDALTGRRPITDHLHHLPRGHRWVWGETTWLACGGAISLDRTHRPPHWYDASEEITAADVARCVDGGETDVLLTHDAPWGVEAYQQRWGLDLPIWRAAQKSGWPADALRDSQESMRKIRQIVDATRPRILWHGHFHMLAHERLGATQIEGLDCNGSEPHANMRLVGPDGNPLED